MKLSILICTIPKRKSFLDRLLGILEPQVKGIEDMVEININADTDSTIGAKRNSLLQGANGDYVCFIDDDDRVSNDYVSLLFDGIFNKTDCCSLKGEITEDGDNPRTFIHSAQYNQWFEKDSTYYRPPNHLNCIRAAIAKQFDFPETNHGEDKDWSMQIARSGQIMTEYHIAKTIYFYEYRSKK